MINLTSLNIKLLSLTCLLAFLSACGGGGGGGGGNSVFNNNIQTSTPTSVSSVSSNTGSTINKPITQTSSLHSNSASTQSSNTNNSRSSSNAPTAPTTFIISLKSYDTIGLTWTPSADNTEITSYKIYRDNVQIDSLMSEDSSYTDFDVAPNRDYDYSISAFNVLGKSSALKHVSVRTPAAPEPPKNLDASSSSLAASSAAAVQDTIPPTAPDTLITTAIFSNHVDLTWTASSDNLAVVAYYIYRDSVLQGTVTANILNYSDNTATQDKSFTYSVEAVDAAGNQSTSKSITIKTPLPVLISAVTLYWSAPTQREDDSPLTNEDLGGYLIRYKSEGSDTFTFVDIKDGSANSQLMSGLTGDYEFQIAAYDKNKLYSKFVNLSPR